MSARKNDCILCLTLFHSCILGIGFLNILEAINRRWYLLATLLKRANFIFILCRVNVLFNFKLFIVYHLGYRGTHVLKNEGYVKYINSKLLFMHVSHRPWIYFEVPLSGKQDQSVSSGLNFLNRFLNLRDRVWLHQPLLLVDASIIQGVF